MMRAFALALCVASLTGCGVESASTAATVAKLKAEETKQAKQNLDRAKTQIAKTQQVTQERLAAARKQ